MLSQNSTSEAGTASMSIISLGAAGNLLPRDKSHYAPRVRQQRADARPICGGSRVRQRQAFPFCFSFLIFFLPLSSWSPVVDNPAGVCG
jgi:hypothetical protein